MLLSPFSQGALGKAGRLGKALELTQHEKAEATLLAMKEFKRYLEGVERDLSRAPKKYSNREIAQGVWFVAAGDPEALDYLAFDRKGVWETERASCKQANASEKREDLPESA